VHCNIAKFPKMGLGMIRDDKSHNGHHAYHIVARSMRNGILGGNLINADQRQSFCVHLSVVTVLNNEIQSFWVEADPT